MGLLQPHERHGRRHGPADMNEVSAARREANSGKDGLDLSRVRSIDGVDVKGKRVLVRVDFNVPIEDGVVADPTRLTRVLPTIAKVAREGARVVVLSHLGRPKGQPTPDTSLRPVAAKMQELMPGIAVPSPPLRRAMTRSAWSIRLSPARSPCSRTFGITRARRKTIASSPRASPRSATFMSMTPFRPRTEHMLR